MAFDSDRAWRQLKALIAQKPHHGQRDLLAEMGRLEVQNDSELGSSSTSSGTDAEVAAPTTGMSTEREPIEEDNDGTNTHPAAAAGSGSGRRLAAVTR